MRLHYNPMSGNSRRVLMTARHLGLPLELVPVDLAKREQRSPEFLRVNPNGRVPVLEDEGLVLTESRAIMQYLADGTPGQTLYPTERAARADVNRWLFWCGQHYSPAVAVLVYERVIKAIVGAGAPDPVEVARGESQLTQALTVLDAHLAGKTWVAQDRLTLADLSLATPLGMAEPARLPVGPYANVRAWLGRVKELEAWKKTAPNLPPGR